jgi:hypothetical protein
MIELNRDNDIVRNGTKVGWIVDNHIFDHMGKKIGYTTFDNYVCDANTAKKLAHIDGDFVYDPNTGKRTRLEDDLAGIESPSLSNIMRVAIRIFFGN